MPKTPQKTPASPPAATPPTKAAQVRDLLTRPEGATLADLCAATGWQPHSARAALSRLRKDGTAIERTAGESGAASIYRIAAAGAAG
ncbi:DUF3489 domain-containing protein [Wenxinia marina]|uniref:DUF3489 domain-containing protein n=1 Tax=Wenxinia marina DSM 24838 TaxID=1123501 RepID=A0A0D0PFU7_9RHOB|nr:DUF3489 domain-containing protein [Wenxinia marina]KIQ70191.1 hypothetical protein Wenmar_01150 [Wenxinia marina DSM 24838]GGL50726.1 hypothetical protein GCM10011392_01070 [Wenxinia marina]